MTTQDRRDHPFYVGYATQAPPETARFLRRTAGVLLIGGLSLAVVLAWIQAPPAPAVFEYGILTQVEGTVLEWPFPMLVVEGDQGAGLLLLAGEQKHGAARLVQGLGGQRAVLTGSRIYRLDGDLAMLEVHAVTPASGGPSQPMGPAPGLMEPEPIGTVELRGEIVDSKCHLGAMNPGDGISHRLCATRCLRGGLAPLLAVTGEPGRGVLLMDRSRSPSGEPGLLEHVGVPVRVRGRASRLGTWEIVAVEPGAVERDRR